MFAFSNNVGLPSSVITIFIKAVVKWLLCSLELTRS
jgi:hypothetical protein